MKGSEAPGSVLEKAYAKINMGLRVTGRRPDGYHLLDMTLQTVSLYDVLYFQEEEEPGLHLELSRESAPDHPDFPFDEKNLITRGVRLLYERAGGDPEDTEMDFRIFGSSFPGLLIGVHKSIPMGAGLGGGSADGAAALRGINRLYGLGLLPEELEELGLKLGADVPFLIRGGLKRAEGVGEILSGLCFREGCLVIAKPDFSVSTPWAYGEYDRRMGEPGEYARPEAAPMGINDLEEAVIPGYPFIGELKSFLSGRGALLSLMSGSGSAVFGLFETEEEAKRAAVSLDASPLGSKVSLYLAQLKGELL